MKKLTLNQLRSKSVKALVAKTATTASKKLAASAGKQSNNFNFRLAGLKFEEYEHMPALKNRDRVDRTETHAIGGGEWSIEVYDYKGRLLKEFVGNNGTRSFVNEFGYLQNEEPDDLWELFAEWSEKVFLPAKDVKIYKAPDGSIGGIHYFYSEARKGRLHGLTMVIL